MVVNRVSELAKSWIRCCQLHRCADAHCITSQIACKALTLLGFRSVRWPRARLRGGLRCCDVHHSGLHFSAVGSAILLHLQSLCLVSLELATANALAPHFGRVIAFRSV